jgi:hypothetical protein
MKCPRRPRVLVADLVEASWTAQFNAYLIARFGNVTAAAHQFDWSTMRFISNPSISDTYVTRRTNGQ